MQWLQVLLIQVLSDELHGRLEDLLWNGVLGLLVTRHLQGLLLGVGFQMATNCFDMCQHVQKKCHPMHCESSYDCVQQFLLSQGVVG